MVKKPAVVEQPVVEEVKAAAVLEATASTLEATAKATAASPTEENLQEFTAVVAARRARMVQLPFAWPRLDASDELAASNGQPCGVGGFAGCFTRPF